MLECPILRNGFRHQSIVKGIAIENSKYKSRQVESTSILFYL